MKPIVRIAPSPTGNLHVGTARTALFNFLFAKKHNGTFIVRIEDTDKERSTEEYENNIKESFEWLGLSYDKKDYYRQSEREDTYRSYIEKMISDGIAYVSKEDIKKEGDREEVIRFKNPNKRVAFEDIIRGTVSFDTTELGDFVIAKSVREPLYHLAVVIDDHEMKITHVIRGEDHISNTPRQILIQEGIGAEKPIYAHIPMILAPDRSKLSKRHGAVSIIEYKEKGYSAEALINYLALLGWNPGTEKEIFTLDELAEEFTLEKIQKGGAIFDEEKLKWINSEHKKRLLTEGFKKRLEIETGEAIKKVFPKGLRDGESKKITNIIWASGAQFSTITEQENYIRTNELKDYLLDDVEPEYPKELLFWKDEKDSTCVIRHLTRVRDILSSINHHEFNTKKIKEAIWEYATEIGRGHVLWPMRVALSGKEKSPDPFLLADTLGKEESLRRMERAIEILNL